MGQLSEIGEWVRPDPHPATEETTLWNSTEFSKKTRVWEDKKYRGGLQSLLPTINKMSGSAQEQVFKWFCAKWLEPPEENGSSFGWVSVSKSETLKVAPYFWA